MRVLRGARLYGVLLFAMILYGVPAFGQTADLAGEYANLNHEDAMERAGGPPLGDYMGIPLSEAGRMRAESNDEAIWGLPEFSCRPHPGPYQWRAAGGVQIRKEIDPVNRELIAFHINWQRSLDRVIYMDGRPHPDENAMHSWSGFSTGEFSGNVLKVTTTHLKESYLKRNGVMFSDKGEDDRIHLPPRRLPHDPDDSRRPVLPHRAVDPDDKLSMGAEYPDGDISLHGHR
jgi:hypothetical protein